MENGLRVAKSTAAKIAAGGPCPLDANGVANDVISQLNDGGKSAIGDNAVPPAAAFTSGAAGIGQVSVIETGAAADNDGCPEPGERVTISLNAVPFAGAQPVDFPNQVFPAPIFFDVE